MNTYCNLHNLHNEKFLRFKIFSRVDSSGLIKTLLREASSSSPGQGFTPLRTRISSASCMPSATQRGNGQVAQTFEDLHMFKSVVRHQDYIYDQVGCRKCVLSRPDPPQASKLFVTLVTEVSLISREPNLRFERISISREFL